MSVREIEQKLELQSVFTYVICADLDASELTSAIMQKPRAIKIFGATQLPQNTTS